MIASEYEPKRKYHSEETKPYLAKSKEALDQIIVILSWLQVHKLKYNHGDYAQQKVIARRTFKKNYIHASIEFFAKDMQENFGQIHQNYLQNMK